MNVKAKKLLSLVLAFVMVLGMLPATVFATNEAGRFADVPAGAWFSDAVQYVSDNGLMVGVDDNHFAPDGLTTRGMVVTVLYRMEGEPSANGTGFTDVEDGAWYTEAILWAQTNGIVEGYGDGTFHPHASMTREEMMAVIYRYSQYKGNDVSSTSVLTVFADSAKIQAYAEDAMSWAVAVGLIKGFHDGTIRPQADSNRAQLATVLMRFCRMFGTEDTCTVTFDSNGGSVVATQTVSYGAFATIPDIPTKDDCAFAGWYTSNTFEEYFEFFETPIVSDIVLYARWIDTADTTDTDGDGLTDSYEEYFGTDVSNIDTDEDGLSDYLELLFLNLDPLKFDSNANGIADGDEDNDGDGLSNLEELAIGTAPYMFDTDMDNLDDVQESYYGTDPVVADTDDDGVTDGKEIEFGTNPLTPDDAFDLNVTADVEDGEVVASVDITLSGEQAETLHIEAVDDEVLFPEAMPGYMGNAFDFSVDGTFEGATIEFVFDPDSLSADAAPTIYYFDEDTQELIALPTVISGNIASAEVTHFSKYILIDRTVYEESFTWVDIWDSDHNYSNVELVFVIDDSGSMDWNDPYNERLSVARTLIDNLPTGSKIGLVRFDGGYPETKALTSALTTDREAVKNYLTTEYFTSYGGTDMYNGIQKAFPLYESTEDTTLKLMIVLSDGETDDTYLHSTVIETANASDIRIYTVGLGDSTSYFNKYLKPLATGTGAAFYLASDAEQLADIYKDINEKIDLETDTDNDGIPDYYEDNAVSFNGVQLRLDKNNPDTDGDKIPDGKELEIKKELNEDGTQMKVTCKLVLGHPLMKDTDSDGLDDDEDAHPFKWDISDRDLAMLAQICYEDIPAGTRLDTLSATYPSYADNITSAFKGAATLEELTGWRVFKTHYSMGGLQIAVYEKDDQLVFACRGSEDKDIWYKSAEFWKDWIVADGLGWITGFNAQAPAAKSFVKKVMNQHTSYDVYVTGHSLGGNVAYNLASKALDVDASRVKKINAYNGLGLLFGLTLGLTDLVDEYRLVNNNEKIKDYHIEGDPVFLLSIFHYGEEIELSMCEKAYGAHDLYSFFVHLPRSKSSSGTGGGGSW